MDPVQCPACPSLVPRTELTNHIAVLHQAEAFRCAVCKFSGLTEPFLTYETIKSHLLEAHGVTEENCLPSTILLPANLLSWSCKICRNFRLKPSEQLVLQHIGQVHGGFFLAASSSSGGWWSAVCRVCDVEGTGEEIRQHEEQHRREGFVKEEKDGEDEAVTGSSGGSWAEDDQLTYQEAQTDLEKFEVAGDSQVEVEDSEPGTDLVILSVETCLEDDKNGETRRREREKNTPQKTLDNKELLQEDPSEVNEDEPELEPESKKAKGSPRFSLNKPKVPVWRQERQEAAQSVQTAGNDLNEDWGSSSSSEDGQEDTEEEEEESESEPEMEMEKCPLCPKLFQHWGAVAGHLRYSHLRDNVSLSQKSGQLVKCPDCPQKFPGVNSALSHVYTEHRHLHFPAAILPQLNRCDWTRKKRLDMMTEADEEKTEGKKSKSKNNLRNGKRSRN